MGKRFVRMDKAPLCACGCGEEVGWSKWEKKWNIFISGHQNKGKDKYKKDKNGIVPLCVCGCNRIVTWNKCKNKWNKYIKGHYWKNQNLPDKYKAKISKTETGKKLSEETKKQISISTIGKKLSEETKTKISLACIGNKNHNWKNGASFEPYCHIWTDQEFKESIRERDNYICQNPYCRKNCNPNRALSLHHIDGNKKDCNPWNIISVCSGCNTRAEGNKELSRDWWQNLYQKIMTEKYGYKYG